MRVLQELRRRHLQQLAVPLPAACARAPARCGWRRGTHGCPPPAWARRRPRSAPRWRSCGPTPGRASSAARSRGTSPPWRSSSSRQVSITFFALALYRPMWRMYGVSPSTPSARMAAGVLAFGNSWRVAMLTLRVGGLRRQDHRDQQLEGRAEFQFAARLGIGRRAARSRARRPSPCSPGVQLIFMPGRTPASADSRNTPSPPSFGAAGAEHHAFGDAEAHLARREVGDHHHVAADQLLPACSSR